MPKSKRRCGGFLEGGAFPMTSVLQKASAWVKNLPARFAAWKSNPMTWVQWIHAMITWSLFILLYLFRVNLWVAFGILFAVTFYLEFWFDPHKEHAGAVGKPDYRDFFFYMVGLTAARLVLLLPHHR